MIVYSTGLTYLELDCHVVFCRRTEVNTYNVSRCLNIDSLRFYVVLEEGLYIYICLKVMVGAYCDFQMLIYVGQEFKTTVVGYDKGFCSGLLSCFFQSCLLPLATQL